EVADAFADGALDVLEVLRGVAGLNVAARRRAGFNFPEARPEFRVFAQRVHHDRVARWVFGVARARVVLLENRVMNDRRRHAQGLCESVGVRSNETLFESAARMKSVRCEAPRRPIQSAAPGRLTV